ncbi:zinc finger protein 665-like [Neocloeon triangulifer]|uniref:zinc finger protein 665-like n=1 Tax=Neocloeon triangulifer TaxID=2078957 RepID=UPI00286F6176|nr:zinc finger protein 665-like [Neocloeon triangulifer]
MAKTSKAMFCSIPTCRFHMPLDLNDIQLQQLAFFCFPENEYLKSLWAEKCSISPTDESQICSLHFTENDFETIHSEFLNFAPKKVLKKDAVPNINLPNNMLCGTVVILNQQLAGNVSTVSVVSHRDWHIDKSGADEGSLSNALISNAKPPEVWELCRMCAGTSENMIPIFNDDGSDKDNISLKLKHMFSLNVCANDALPVRLCSQCLMDLNFCHQTALKCAQADATLRCLMEAESVSANQDVGGDWQLHDDVPHEIHDANKHGWQSQVLEPSTWSRENEVQHLPGISPQQLSVAESIVLKDRVNETTMITTGISREPSVVLTLQPSNDNAARQTRLASSRLRKEENLIINDSHASVQGKPVENLENVPLRDRLRNKNRKKTSILSCSTCKKTFETEVDLKEHLRNTHQKYQCKDCEELFDSKEAAEKHAVSPHNIPCLHCKETFASRSLLNAHTEVEHITKKPFVCLDCGLDFAAKTSLRVHMKNHTGKRITVCDICGKSFRTCDALRQHKFVHMTDEEKKNMGFPCTMCDKKFSRRTKLEYHMRRHTGERHFTCTICSKSFHDSVRLKAHTERHSTDKKFKCDECGSGFVCKRYLTNHKSRYHRRREVIRCSVCSIVLPSAEEAMTHHREHTAEEVAKSGTSDPYTQSYDHHCRQCCEYFPSKELLSAHKAKMHVRGRMKVQAPVDITELIKQVDCTVCGKKLWGQGSLKRHMSTHASTRPERIFQCEFCAKMFAQRAQLVVHIRTHTGERPHRCSFCGKGFITGQSLIKHERIHTGETPFHCSQCPKAFRSKENLILHQKTHLGLKPFECHYCHKSFGRQIHLQLHLRTHTGERPYVCDVCGRAFAQGGDMRRHRLTHTGERAYKCSVCCFSSNKRKTLRDHEASAHGKRPVEQNVATPIISEPVIAQPVATVIEPLMPQQLAPAPQQYASNIIMQDSRAVMFLNAPEIHKNWGDN